MDFDITYERNIYKSYMKISAIEQENLDEKILLSQEIEGLLPIEKHYFEGQGQYWYDISGKQALDHYCKINEVGIDLFEQLILQICNQLERFEWNLLRAECLLLRPETVFIRVSDERICLTGYPREGGSIFEEIQAFMEFLLMKINHSDEDAVRSAYEIYELILKGEFHVSDLRDFIIEKRMARLNQTQNHKMEATVVYEDRTEERIEEKEEEITHMLHAKIKAFIDGISMEWRKIIPAKKDKEELPEIVYAEEHIEPRAQVSVHPTVCLTTMSDAPSGRLMYEGAEHFKDCEIGKDSCLVGKSHRVKLQIERDTISHFHAKIEYKEDGYYIEDMNSTNGTYVNDTLLNFRESRKLYAGDLVRFADVKYRFL